MLLDWVQPVLPALLGAVGGLVLGLAARLGRFCTLGAIEDHFYGGSDSRLRMWGIAIGVALLAVALLDLAQIFDPAESFYLQNAWNPLAHVVGGLLFGGGMALAGNCGYGAVARLGGGDLRAFVIVLVMGISAYVVMSGPLALLRVTLFPPDLITAPTPAGFAHTAQSALGLPVWVFFLLVGAGLCFASMTNPEFRQSPKAWAWGGAVGLTIGYGWAASSLLNHHTFGEVDIQSYTFAAPLGESILYAMTASGSTLTFAVGAVAGVWTGAFAGSVIKGHFRWEACEDPRELRRQIFGAMMMGSGAVLSLGCSVGQGISALSLLSYGSVLTLVGIFLGAFWGLKYLIEGHALT